VFFRYYATYPYYSDAVWYLTQMRRWGQIPRSQPDAWYHEAARNVYRTEPYMRAARLLIEEKKARREDFPWNTDGFRAPTKDFIDGVEYDGHKPNEYLQKLSIGLKQGQVVESGKVVTQQQRGAT
jgi:nitrate/nitrite transport system substrate-binding protein